MGHDTLNPCKNSLSQRRTFPEVYRPLERLLTRLWGNFPAAQRLVHPKRPRLSIIHWGVKMQQTIPRAIVPGHFWDMWPDCCQRQFVQHPIPSSLNSNRRKCAACVDCFMPTWGNSLYHHSQTHELLFLHVQLLLCSCDVSWREWARGKAPSLSPQHSSEGRNILSHKCRRTENWREKERERDGWLMVKWVGLLVKEIRGLRQSGRTRKPKRKRFNI